jgi:Fe-coproporphyrin III synthase
VLFTLGGNKMTEEALACIYSIRPEMKKVMIELTKRCNTRCKHCIADASEDRTEDELDTEQIINLIDQMVEFGISELYVTGGEPRVRKDYFEIMDYASNKFKMLATATNGIRLSDEYFNRTAEINLHHLNLSLDHHTKKFNDDLRGEGVYDEVMKSIDGLSARGVNIMLSTMLSKHNQDNLEGVIKLAEEKGIKSVVFNWMLPFGRASQNKDYIASKDEYRTIINEIKRLHQKYEIDKGSVRVLYRRYPAGEVKPLEKCFGGESLFFITSVGEISPCPFLSRVEDGRFLFGNLKEQEFSDVVYSDDFKSSMVGILNPEGYNDSCGSCNAIKKCGYGCPAFSYAWNGKFHSLDPLCEFR